MQTKVAAYDTNIGAHNLIYLLDVLGNEDFLLVGHCPFIIPFRHFFVEVVAVYILE